MLLNTRYLVQRQAHDVMSNFLLRKLQPEQLSAEVPHCLDTQVHSGVIDEFLFAMETATD